MFLFKLEYLLGDFFRISLPLSLLHVKVVIWCHKISLSSQKFVDEVAVVFRVALNKFRLTLSLV